MTLADDGKGEFALPLKSLLVINFNDDVALVLTQRLHREHQVRPANKDITLEPRITADSSVGFL